MKEFFDVMVHMVGLIVVLGLVCCTLGYGAIALYVWLRDVTWQAHDNKRVIRKLREENHDLRDQLRGKDHNMFELIKHAAADKATLEKLYTLLKCSPEDVT